MKKGLLTIFLFSLFNVAGFTQNNYSIGVNIGPNYASFRGSDVLDNTDSAFGYLAGLFVEYRINENFAIKSGLNLEQKSIKYETDYTVDYFDEQTGYVNEGINVKTSNKYKYLTIPLLLKYSFGKSKSFFVNGGCFISFLQKHIKKTRAVNDRGQVFRDYYSSNPNDNFPLADNVEGDYGVSVGFGKCFKINDKNIISIELRDNLGLHNALDGTFIYGKSGVIKTNSLSLITSWSFNL